MAVNPANPLQPPLQTPLGLSPDEMGSFAESYINSHRLNEGFMKPLEKIPNWQPGAQPSQQELAMMGAHFQGLTTHPLQTGAAPKIDSAIFNQLSGGMSEQISKDPLATQVAKGIYQNTVGAFIEQAKANPLATAAEVIGIGALFVGAGALDAATFGLATPLLWTGFAMFALPTLLPATTSAVQNALYAPTDQNIAQLMIMVGTAALTLGSPVKAFRGIGAQRALTAAQMRQVAFLHQPGEVTNLVTRDRQGNLGQFLLPGDRFPVLPQTVDQLEQEVARRKAAGDPLDDEELINKYRTSLQEHDILASRIADINMGMEDVKAGERPRGEGGKFRKRQDYLDEAAQKLQEQTPEEQQSAQTMIPIMKEFGHRFGYRLARENPMGRISAEEFKQIDPGQAAKADKAFRSVWGILYAAGEGHGWDGAPEGSMYTDFAANLAESMARNGESGGLEHGQRLLQDNLLQGMKHLGLDVGDMKAIYSAIHGHNDPLEDQKLFDALTPHQKLAAEKLHITFGIMTNYAYKHGHIELPLDRYVPWMVEHSDPNATPGVRLYLNLREALAPSSKPVKNASWALTREGVQSEWDMANELQNAEFDPQEGAATIADRLRRTAPSRDEFEAKESGKKANYAEFQPFKEAFGSGEGNQMLLEKRREFGSYVKGRNHYQERMDAIPGELSHWTTIVAQSEQKLRSLEAQQILLKGQRGSGAQRAALEQEMKTLRNDIRKARTSHRHRLDERGHALDRLNFYKERLETMPQQWAKQAGVPGSEKWFNTEEMKGDDIKRALTAQPGGRTLVGGFDLPRIAFARYLRQMNQARYRSAWESMAPADAPEDVKLAYGAHSNLTLAEHAVQDMDKRPIVLHGNINPGDRGTDAHQALLDHGYEMVMPAMGVRGALNYRPALFARKDIVGRYRELAQRARDAKDMQSAWAQTFLYQSLFGVPRKLIMGSPAWHGKNVAGRALITILNHPGLATNALMTQLKDRFLNPDMYYQTKLEHWSDGGVPAHRFNVAQHLNWQEQELSGQRNFGWQMRHPLGALDHAHAQLAEGWFWKTVDDVGTMAHQVQKYRLMATKPWMSEQMAGALAAEYANNVSGMVNPLYMSKLWRVGRQMLFFAPGWWTTFARMTAMAIPGSTRLSSFLKDTKRLEGLDPVKFHSLDFRHRKEMVRMHRSYFTTMMAAALVTHDLMNFMFSGHHIWENQKGHEWDLEMDKFYAPKVSPSTGQEQHVHMHSIQFYSQMADLFNAMGLGHDWGFLNQMNTDQFKQANAAHKAGIIGQALGQGTTQIAAGKLSTGINLGIGVGAGMDPYSLLRDRKVEDMNRMEALLGALPGGYYAQRQIDQYNRAALKAQYSGDWTAAHAEQQKILPTALGAAETQFLGFPSLYYSGDEPINGYHFLSQNELGQYLQRRNDILSSKKAISDKLMQGGMTPSDWVIQNEMQTQRYLELLSITFGDQSTGKSLFDLRRQLYTKYGLDNPSQSRAEQEYGLQQFESDWEQQLQQASPEAKSMWWESHTSMWTDADYLYWLTGQMRNSIMSHIDGNGGDTIREAQRRLGRQGLPLTPKATDLLRQQNPYLWTYYQVMSSLGKTSMLGALTSAYHDPFSNFTVFPDDAAPMIQALAEQGAFPGNVPLVRASTMAHLGEAARGIGQGAGEQGGEIAGEPGVQQAATGLSAQAARNILESNSKLTDEERAWLEQVASGRRA
jgi:hypothetical protein